MGQFFRKSRSIAVLADLQHSQESFLGYIDATDALHSFFAFLLFLEKLPLARNITAVALGDYILANGGDSFAGDDFRADRRLDRHFEHLPWNELPHFRDKRLTPVR